jgi:hypothetical protein
LYSSWQLNVTSKLRRRGNHHLLASLWEPSILTTCCTTNNSFFFCSYGWEHGKLKSPTV